MSGACAAPVGAEESECATEEVVEDESADGIPGDEVRTAVGSE